MDISKLTKFKISDSKSKDPKKVENNINLKESDNTVGISILPKLVSNDNDVTTNNLNSNNQPQLANGSQEIKGGKWNQHFVNTKLALKARLKSGQVVPTKEVGSESPSKSLTPEQPVPVDLWPKSNSIYNGNGNVDAQRKEGENLKPVSVSDGNAENTNPSWNRIFKCFSVFKPKKFSSNKELKPPELKRTMTESDFFLYEIANRSEILNYQDTKNLAKYLPPRAIGYPWELTFSTTSDGFSLHSLYRKMEEIDSPVIVVIEDIEGRVFGAIVSCAFRVSEHFYGNSDTFLFRCRPHFDVFKWSGDNFYFIQSQDSFLSVGSDDGKYGLWLDDNLYLGRTEKCSTFASPPLIEEKDFKIKTVECWTLGEI